MSLRSLKGVFSSLNYRVAGGLSPATENKADHTHSDVFGTALEENGEGRAIESVT